MIYSSKILFLIYLSFGFASAFAFDILYLIQLIFKNKQLITIICDAIATFALGSVTVILNTTLNMGIVRAYLVSAFVFGAILQRKTLGKLFAKYSKKLYNWLSKVIKNVKKSKTFAALSK